MSDIETLDAVDQSAEDTIDTPATDAAVETEATDTPAESAERARDERGRFAALEAIATEPVTADTPAVEDAAAVPVPDEPVAPVAEPSPFTVRALGNDYTIEGGTIAPDGSATFAPEAVQRLHQLFGRSVLINKRAAEVERERAGLRAERAALEAYHKPLEDEVWSKLKGAQTQEDFIEIAAGLWLNREVIDAKRELAKERATLTVQNEAPQVSPDEQRDELERNVDTSIRETFTEVRGASWAKGLTADDWREIEQDVRATRSAFLVQQQDGVYYNGPEVQAFVQRQAARITREREKATATARQAQKAAQKNAAATVSAVKAPPGVGTSAPARQPAVAAAKPAPRATERTERDRKAERAKFDQWIMTGKD